MGFSQEDKDFLKELYDTYYGSRHSEDQQPDEASHSIKVRKKNRKKKKEVAKTKYVKDQC